MAEETFDDVSLQDVRVDRWLFAVRIFKSRSLAARAVGSGKVKVNGESVKTHRPLRRGDFVTMKRDGRTMRYEVLGLVEKRVGASQAKTMYELMVDPDLDPDAKALIELYRDMDKMVPKQKGRPTKRDRRKMERFHNELDQG